MADEKMEEEMKKERNLVSIINAAVNTLEGAEFPVEGWRVIPGGLPEFIDLLNGGYRG